MPSVERKGKKGKYVEIPDDLDRRFQAFCEGRGVKYTAQVVLAMERHLAYPPPPPVPPALPPLPADAPARKSRRR
jgi:hypothetical protein